MQYENRQRNEEEVLGSRKTLPCGFFYIKGVTHLPPPPPLTEKYLKEGKKTFFGITLSVHWPTISVFIICSRFVLGHLQEDILFAIDKFLIVNLGDCDIVNH